MLFDEIIQFYAKNYFPERECEQFSASSSTIRQGRIYKSCCNETSLFSLSIRNGTYQADSP